MEIKGIIFDYGGTIDSGGRHWAWVIRDAWRDAGLDIDITTFRAAYVYAERELARVRHVMPDFDFHATMLAKARVEMLYLVEREKISPDDLELYAVRIAEHCDRQAREWVRRARPVLQALSERYPIALVSNFYGNVNAVLATYDLSRYFQAVIESAVVGVRKPNPAIFQLGVDALGLPPEHVLVVGDSYAKDILPARSLGCPTLWVKGRGWTHAEDAVTDPDTITSLDEVEARLG